MAAERAPQKREQNKKPAGKTEGGKQKFPSLQSPWTWALVLGIAVVGGGIILWRNHQKAAAAASDGSSTTGTAGTSDTTGDAAATNDAALAGTLQDEIGNLQSSLGQVDVPNVVGMTAAEATNAIKTVNLHPVNPKGTPAGNVVSATSPAAGTQAAPGSDVTITSAPKGSKTSSPGGSTGTGSGTTTSSGSGSSSSSGGGSTSTVPKADEHSWTDTGQVESASALAKALGIPLSALKPSNQAATDSLNGQPGKLIPKGAKFTYVKA